MFYVLQFTQWALYNYSWNGNLAAIFEANLKTAIDNPQYPIFKRCFQPWLSILLALSTRYLTSIWWLNYRFWYNCMKAHCSTLVEIVKTFHPAVKCRVSTQFLFFPISTPISTNLSNVLCISCRKFENVTSLARIYSIAYARIRIACDLYRVNALFHLSQIPTRYERFRPITMLDN